MKLPAKKNVKAIALPPGTHIPVPKRYLGDATLDQRPEAVSDRLARRIKIGLQEASTLRVLDEPKRWPLKRLVKEGAVFVFSGTGFLCWVAVIFLLVGPR